MTDLDAPTIDFIARSQKMHRRAQRAEARDARLLVLFKAALTREEHLRANKRTRERKLKRARSELRTVRDQLRDPLTRIIQIGREFP